MYTDLHHQILLQLLRARRVIRQLTDENADLRRRLSVFENFKTDIITQSGGPGPILTTPPAPVEPESIQCPAPSPSANSPKT